MAAEVEGLSVTGSTEVSMIDNLPLPSTLDLPLSSHGLLPSLAATTNGGDPSVLNPLPPPLPIDPYDVQYGPTSVTEPQLEAPSTTDGELPKFDEVNDQYDFLRRTLSHSRRRYSARYKRPRPKPQARDENEDETSLDIPGQRREEPSPVKIQPPTKNTRPVNKHHTVRGMQVHGDYQRRLQQQRTNDRRSSPATVRSV